MSNSCNKITVLPLPPSLSLPSFLFLQVFLDEVNTSSCLGLFKEIIVDRTIDGKVLTFLRDVYVLALPSCLQII